MNTTIPNSVTSIGGSAFFGCSSLTSVTIPNSVTSIDNGAFYNCSGLTSVNIPNSITSIGYNAFEGCYFTSSSFINNSSLSNVDNYNWGATIVDEETNDGLLIKDNTVIKCRTWATSVTIPNNVTSIGYNAFEGRTGLTSITIPNSVTTIWEWAFYNCSSLTSITIPNSVTSIGRYAFSGCSGLTSINIPNSVTSIGEYAFSGCNSLTSISIDCPTVGYWFSGLPSVKEITFSNNVTTISNGAFSSSHLESVTLGSGIQSIGKNAFSTPTKVIWLSNTPPEGYKNVKGKINFVPNNQYTALSNMRVYSYLSSIFEVGGIKYVPISPSERTCDAIDCKYDSLAENINICETVSYRGISMKVQTVQPYVCSENPYIKEVVFDYEGNIPDYACYNCTSMTSATIGNSVTSIGSEAFNSCNGLSSVNIPNSVTYIGSRAFNNCGGLTSIAVADGNEAYDSRNNCNAIIETASNTLIQGCKYTTIPNSVTNIGNYAFYNCRDLISVNIPNSVTYIGDYAFYNCRDLTSVNIPNSVTNIGDYAFEDCMGLTSIAIPNSVSSIGESAFSGCSGLKELTFVDKQNLYDLTKNVKHYEKRAEPALVLTIGRSAFENCSSLASFTVPDFVTSIGDNTFLGCTALIEVVFEEKASDIYLGSNGSNPLFSDCPLDSVFIGRNISYPTSSSYGYSPFYRNTSLRSIHITNVETEVSNNEFYGCTNLKNVRLGDGITKIGNWAFSGCSSLDYFIIGRSTNNIGKEAFSDCTAMKRLISRATTPPTCGDQALDDINKWECTLEVPVGSLTAYQNANQWKEFFFMEEGMTGLKVIDNGELKIDKVYDLSGRKLSQMQRGINIIRMKDGTTKKVLIK